MHGVCGIYQIYNIATNKSYIGSSSDIGARRNQHLPALRNNYHANRKLQNAFNKYGEDSFRFISLGEVPEQDLIEVEQLAIDTVRPEYNIRLEAQSNRGLIAWNRGGFPEELKQKKIDQFAKSVVAYDFNGKFVKKFISATEAAQELGLRKGQVAGVINNLKGRAKSCAGYQFRYADNHPLQIEPYQALSASQSTKKDVLNNKYVYNQSKKLKN